MSHNDLQRRQRRPNPQINSNSAILVKIVHFIPFLAAFELFHCWYLSVVIAPDHAESWLTSASQHENLKLLNTF